MNAIVVPKIAFIGAGNMAGAILRGLLAQGYPVASLWAADPSYEKLAILAQETGIHTSTTNDQAIAAAEVVVLAVKPQVMQEVLKPLRPLLQEKRPLVLSIAAGLTCKLLQSWLGEGVPLVRSMPNTPSLVGAGVAGIYAAPEVTAQQRQWVEQISQAVGLACWVEDEALLDAVTAISGSGPAYYFLFTEALAAAGEKLGLPAQLALQLAKQTAWGSGALLVKSADTPAELRAKVTSPGGTTAKALQVFNEQGLLQLVDKAAQAAAKRAKTLAKELS